MIVFVDTGAWVAIADRNNHYNDKDFSFTDCTSFALMERLKIKTAFSFDAHFTQYGFIRIPLF